MPLTMRRRTCGADGEAGGGGGFGDGGAACCSESPQRARAGAEAPDDYDVIGTDGLVIGRIFRATTAPSRNALDVDAGLRAARGPHTDARLQADARGGDGGVCEELPTREAACNPTGVEMIGKTSPDERALMRKMLQALKGEPVVPRHVANASFAIMCLALTKMEPHERDHLLATLNAAARSQVTTLLTDEDGGLKWH